MKLEQGQRITVVGVSWMAITYKSEIEIVSVDDVNPGIIAAKHRGKRRVHRFRIDHELVFSGWDITLKTDSELFGAHGSVLRGNACVNFIGRPEEVRGFVEEWNINPLAKKSCVVAIVGYGTDADVIPVYPELHDGHAVIDRMLERIDS